MTGYLLDTTVLSEIARPRPNAGLRLWFEGQTYGQTYVAAPTIGEIVAGISALDPSPRRAFLEQSLADLSERFAAHILAFDTAAARAWGAAMGAARRSGKTLPPVDTQIAAIAHANGLAVVTRNVRDFERTGFVGLSILNPWT